MAQKAFRVPEKNIAKKVSVMLADYWPSTQYL